MRGKTATRKAGIPGDDLPFVQYQLGDAEDYANETIVVIGAGDGAIANALALAKKNRVVIVNRRDDFDKANSGNRLAIEKAIATGKIECVYNAAPIEIKPDFIYLKTGDGTRDCRCDRVIARLGAMPPRKFLESCGIEFHTDDWDAMPVISAQYESNVPGIYIIGAIAGYQLIKQCLNLGYEVVEAIAGFPVVPADEPLLEHKLRTMPNRPSIGRAIEEIKRKVDLFQGLTTLQLREFLLDSEMHIMLAGQQIFQRNDFGDTLFCIVSGTIEIEPHDDYRPATPPYTVIRRESDFFGEVGLISGRRRTGAARARTDCLLIELSRWSAVKLLKFAPMARKLFDHASVVRQLQDDLLPNLTEVELACLVATAKLERFGAGRRLITEGTQNEQSVYLIRSGSVAAFQRMNGKIVLLSYHPAGHLVGEMPLLRNEPQTATFAAVIETEAIRLSGVVFGTLLNARPDLRARIEHASREKFQDPL